MESVTEPSARAESVPRRAWRGARAIVRLCLCLAIALVLAAAWFLGLCIVGRGPRRRVWRASMVRRWARASLWSANAKLEVQGTPPPAPCFLVANHVGWVDVWSLAASCDCVFVSMEELLRWPLFGPLARSVDTVFIVRERKRDIPAVNRSIEEAFTRGERVVFFPEGYSTIGTSVDAFKPSLFEPAAQAGLPVGWATLHYATGPRDWPAAFSVPWGDRNFARQVWRFFSLDRIEARVRFGDGVLRGSDRKQLASELHARIEQLFVPLADGRSS